MRERRANLLSRYALLFFGATCPPELTPGDSPMGSLEMSIGDLEQEELCGAACRALRAGRVHLHRCAYVARMRPASSDFLRGARASTGDRRWLAK